MATKANVLKIENGRLIFRNFRGKESKYNRAGVRSFGVIIDEDAAEKLRQDGWNIKQLESRDPDDSPTYFLRVAVNFDHIPPKLYVVVDGKATELDEDTVDELDFAEIESANIYIRPYSWEVNGKTGIKAYLKTIYVEIAKDEFAEKYSFVETPVAIRESNPLARFDNESDATNDDIPF